MERTPPWFEEDDLSFAQLLRFACEQQVVVQTIRVGEDLSGNLCAVAAWSDDPRAVLNCFAAGEVNIRSTRFVQSHDMSDGRPAARNPAARAATCGTTAPVPEIGEAPPSMKSRCKSITTSADDSQFGSVYLLMRRLPAFSIAAHQRYSRADAPSSWTARRRPDRSSMHAELTREAARSCDRVFLVPSTLPRITTGLSIYDVVRAGLAADGRLRDSDVSLPDDPERDGSTILWAPGAADEVMGAVGGDDTNARAKDAARLLAKAVRRPTRRALGKLYTALVDDSAPAYVDLLLDEVIGARLDGSAVHELGVWLATTATDRGPVKIGLALIGITGLGHDVDVVTTLGAHDEFTLFAAVAIGNGVSEPERDLWRLAQSVDGWGRIQCVERLRGTNDPEIKEWLLRDGYRNTVMYEYLAYIVATTGGLLDALHRRDLDRDLLTSSGEIIDALIAGGPAEDIGDLPDAPAVISAYLDLMHTRAETLVDLRTVVSIARLLGGGDDEEVCIELGWEEDDRARLASKVSAVLDLPLWPHVIAAGLESDDAHTFWLANAAAAQFGIDTFGVQWERLQSDPLGGPWYDAWRLADSEPRRESLVALARATFTPESIVTGGPDTLGFGLEFHAHRAFDWTLQELRHHTGLAPDLVALGLRSPMIRNRNMALNALKAWPVAAWPEGAENVLRSIASSDAYEPTRLLAREVLDRLNGA